MSDQPLFTPVRMGGLDLPNRIVMAPLTRMRAGSIDHAPTGLQAEYYAQRASAGLIVAEATAISPDGFGWADTPASIDRTLERTAMREFDYRVLFQMSANDSSNLIDSPAANKLGSHRALVYSEEQGVSERFRPYALPETDWLAEVRQKLVARPV